MSEIVPTSHLKPFSCAGVPLRRLYRKLCKGMSHYNEVGHVSARLHIHRFRPWAPVRVPGVCFLTNASGSRIAHFERFCSPAG